jgi:crotonobetainyl-CoA:carnitine CoA-transferase CaiB-like acyl-CoA transferase
MMPPRAARGNNNGKEHSKAKARTMSNPNTGALDGIRVVDLTRILAGPLCTMMLGDMGADVIKIEPPTGDDTRRWGPPFAGDDAAYFLGINRNKRSLTLNMAVAEGQKILAGLIAKADVLLVFQIKRDDNMPSLVLCYMDI